jgi:hypothetical protein
MEKLMRGGLMGKSHVGELLATNAKFKIQGRVLRNIKFPFAVYAFSLLASCQTYEQRKMTRNAYFPAEMESNVWLNLATFREPNLFRENDDAYESRYRLSISGISCNIYVIRIDERTGGELIGKLSSRNKCKNGPMKSRFFRPSTNDFVALKMGISAANMFKFYPEVWRDDKEEDTICLDGNMLVFERRSKEGYSVSSANAQCDAPYKLHQVAQQFVAMSGEKNAANLIK